MADYDIVNNQKDGRFEVRVGGDIAFAEYRMSGRGTLRQRFDPADHLDVYPHDGRYRTKAGDGKRHPVGQLCGGAVEGALSGALCRPQRRLRTGRRPPVPWRRA